MPDKFRFSKELEAQLIPEWKEAFVNYWQLKKQIKSIKLAKQPKHPPLSAVVDAGDFGRSLFDSARFLAATISAALLPSDHQPDFIKVRRKFMKNGQEEVYETELAQLFSEEDEVRLFFARLDEELNKVNQFYKRQESEFLERGEILQKQLQILLDLKQILTDRRRKNSPTAAPKGLNPEIFSHSPPRGSDYSENFGESDETNSEISQTDEVVMATTLERRGVSFVTKTKKGKPKVSMRIDIPATTPTRAITAITSMLWEDLVTNPKKEGSNGDFNINKRKIQCAEKMIRKAFVELYKALGLLKTYSSLNMVAFSKILKKFDKVSCQKASANYLKEVKRSHFISSDKVVRLMDEVESIFTKHFANNDRKKAMKFLRPQHNKDSHMVTFFVGLLTGCFVSLFCVYAILAHLCGIFSSSTEESAYMETVYPVFSVFALLSLHLFMYGCNLYMWKSTRINYNFIFEFSPNTALKHRDAFLISTTFMTAVIGAMVLHLLLRAAGISPTQVDAIPGILMLIPLLRHLETTCCHFFARIFNTHHPETCHSGRLYMEITYVISFLPYYWRALQCARRWFDDSDVNHLANMGKYVSAMVAAGARVTYGRQDSALWFAIVLISSVVATIYQLYWDFVKDWGFLNPNSRNPWLRDDLILKNRSVYYISMGLNVVLRVAWVETVMHLKVGLVQSRMVEFLLASLEVIRRGHWNFYRLENEHLNNVGHYRAVKAVPLPFRETEFDN
ncbi:phosphate transporter PHO1-like [Senna tora]|uniref:Phosphate transporter PHO1-like n=1 Tax=Senna tora TaxID=362788 RepID=A0A834SQF7_9FABA|nr:phosphate transporter PHO1-like [Senna tora]